MRMLLAPILFGALACAPAPAPHAVTPEFFPAADSALRTLPFSEAVAVGDLLFLSGQIGVVPGTLALVPGGLEPEARQAMENIKAVLGRHGSSMEKVVKCTIFLADMAEWPAFNAVYRTYFPGRYPARSAFGANGLARGARVEVECIASR